MRKLTSAQEAVIMALVQKRNQYIDALDDYIKYLGAEFRKPAITQMQDGIYIHEEEQEERKD